jgi:hypothetical protein
LIFYFVGKEALIQGPAFARFVVVKITQFAVLPNAKTALGLL